MKRDPLATLVRLRKAASEDVRRTLAGCMQAEDAALAALSDAEMAIIREQDAAAALGTDDAAVEAFAAWLPTGRRAVAQARAAHDQAGAATVQARAALAVARASAEAVERLLAARDAEQAADAARRAQAALDEAAGRGRGR